MHNRRFSLYFSWSRDSENQRELGVLENRYPTLFEFRRAIWPHYEWARDPENFKQDVSGFLDHVILHDFKRCREVLKEATDRPVGVIERRANGAVAPISDDLVKGCDTLIVVSLDHFESGQHPSSSEAEAVRQFLEREEACLIVCPHHAIGAADDQPSREIEFRHHGDRLVPAQQLIGGFAKSLLSELGVAVENRYGLNPARSLAGGGPASLDIASALDDLRVLEGVSTFNLHPHLPHLHFAGGADGKVRVLARQPINLSASTHPFVQAGNKYFNALLWIPPDKGRAGNIFVCDATLWSAAFDGVSSLERFWRNLARL